MTLDNYVDEFKTAIGYQPDEEHDAIIGHFIVIIQKCLTSKEKEMQTELEQKYAEPMELLKKIAEMTEGHNIHI